MVQHFAYRMDHDTGFAPNISLGICSLTGCKNSKTGKKRNIEELATNGSWVVGIGGNGTKQPNKLLYAMKVAANLTLDQFRDEYPEKSRYLIGHKPGGHVLVSDRYYYFGNQAIDVPVSLGNIIVSGIGFKHIPNELIDELEKMLNKYAIGSHGEPNNPEDKAKCKSCHGADR